MAEDSPQDEKRYLIVETDGGSRGNPGHAGYGALVRDPSTGKVIAEEARYLGKVSNNVAEYSGLVAGLKLVDSIDSACRILVRMDSKLAVEQMSGRWKIKHEDMRKLATEARSTVNPHRVRYEWIPREKNKDADRLSNEAMDAGEAGRDWTPTSKGPPPTATATATEPEVTRDKPSRAATGRFHHVELWVNNFSVAESSLGWMLERLGYQRGTSWSSGAAWNGAGEYIVIESGTDVESEAHRRRLPGLNHLAFRGGNRNEVDLLARRATSHGWSLMFADKHPHAGGADHYAAYLENEDGFEIEIVAD
nr:reverse transcriptase-like protein [Arthrobacter roseus]